VVFLDESGFLLQPVCRRTWAPRGQTPIQDVWQRHDRLSVLGAISLSPVRRRLSVSFAIHFENIRADDAVHFLHELHRHHRRKIVLVWDRWNVHRSAARQIQKQHPDWFEFVWLPTYAPELNPSEHLWNHSKYTDLANHAPDDKYELYLDVHDSLANQGQRQSLLRSYFHAAGLKP